MTSRAALRPRRARHFRAARVRLECGCTADLSTGRYRVGKAIEAMTFGHYVRVGVWCTKHGGLCQPTETIGVVRQ